ncbi:DUF262 domain-containing protein [Nocardia abscessus]|uniref:HNH endonuclease family protein n=1 Tax=Nocardia abscessus TaxID=120957 RepID=UPI001893D2F0|nr:DUF262 domain-containing HNH endonuclease family protein [Nocardia abscessus]MBF6220986.1 DUF262 domain-containing protein [Nocardia abscessus]
METREIFDAAPLSVSQFLSEVGQGLYIPPYQRAYTWEQSKVNRLLSDIAHGLDLLRDLDDSICFLGTVIALRDLKYETVDPKYREHMPNKVMTIIDGQQRLTTLLLLTTVLHEEITVRAKKIGRKDEAATWCYNHALDITKRLTTCYEEDMRWGDFQYYPRLIRSYFDVWSRNNGEARYTSPIGYYLHKYGEYARNHDSIKQYTHEPISSVETDGMDIEAYRHLDRIRYQMRTILRKAVAATEDNDEELQLPSGREIGDSSKIQLALFNSEFPPAVISALTEHEDIGRLSRMIVFANYLLNRVTVAVVTAKREDYGFDMFEALNTTGQPLTAIETFKPRALQAEGLDEWQNSASKKYFDVVEAYLDREASTSADKRQAVTSSILLPFALMEDGTKLTKRLSDQRQYLRKVFDKDANAETKDTVLENRRTVLSGLSQVVRFYEGPWAETPKIPNVGEPELQGQAGLALAALRNGGHEIVVGLLTRYFAAHRLASSEKIGLAGRQFLLAARTCCAFYALWRGAFGGTNGIDAIYRALMKGDVPDSGFARHTSALTEVPPVEDLQAYLRSALIKRQLGAKDEWVAKASLTPVYSSSKPLTRLLLLAASQNSTPDNNELGLVVRGKNGLLETLTLSRWTDDAVATIEHVAPQKRQDNSGWNDSIYQDSELIDRLGNLTLLPRIENASASNREWRLKRLMFQALSAATLDDAEKLITDAKEQGVELSSGAAEIVKQARYLPLVAAVAQRNEDWTAEFVNTRSERLCELAWDSLAPWLGF